MQGIHYSYKYNHKIVATNPPFCSSYLQTDQRLNITCGKHKPSSKLCFNGLRLQTDRAHEELIYKKRLLIRKQPKKSSRLVRYTRLNTKASLLADLCNHVLVNTTHIPSSTLNHLSLDGIPSLVLTKLPNVLSSKVAELYVGAITLLGVSANVSLNSNSLLNLQSSKNLLAEKIYGLNDDDDDVDGEMSNLTLPFMHHYDANAITDYYNKRQFLVLSRFSFILRECCSMLFMNAFIDSKISKSTSGATVKTRSQYEEENSEDIEDIEKMRASQLADLLIRLGPTAIKIGLSLSTRSDLLSPAYIRALERLEDLVHPFPDEEARNLIVEELGHPIEHIFSQFSAEPVSATSLGQVYKAKLRVSGETVAVKVQRPDVLSTISLDLYIIRSLAMGISKLPNQQGATDFLMFLDQWADHLFQELDYTIEAKSAEQFGRSVRFLQNVVVPNFIMEYTTNKVLTSSWIEVDKLSKNKDGAHITSVALNCYLSQLLDSGFIHADPHPGNLLQTRDGHLCVLDFGLMIEVPEDQRYALIECMSHIVHSDFEKVGNDLINLGFLPSGQVGKEMAAEILPHLSRVLERLVKGGGTQHMDVDQILADLVDLANEYKLVIPTYFTTIFRAFSILEGMGLKSNPDYAIIDECYPYICKKLLTDNSPRARAILKYFLYGKKEQLDAARVEAVFRGFQEFQKVMVTADDNALSLNDPLSKQIISSLFAPEGSFIQELLLAELVRIVDALSREAIVELWKSFVGVAPAPFPQMFVALWPLPNFGLFGVASYSLSHEDKEALALVKRLWKLMGSEVSTHTLLDMRMVTESLKVMFPQITTGAVMASTRFWLMLLHRKALRYADDLDGTNSLVYWNKDPAAHARHVRPLMLPFAKTNTKQY